MTLQEDVISNLRSYTLGVFPLKDKRPLNNNWQNYTGQIREGQPFGVVMGGKSGIFSLDVDDYSLRPHFEPIINKTYCVKSGNGFHIYVKANTLPQTMRLDNQKNQHIDIQSTGTYVVGETSTYYAKNPDGSYTKTDKTYEIISKTREINEVDFEKEVKPVLSQLGFEIKRKSIGETIDDAIKNGIPEGCRNQTLFDYARHLKHTVKLDDNAIMFELQRFNQNYCNPPISQSELETIANSAKTYKTSRGERREYAYDDEKTYGNRDFDLVAREILERYNFVTLKENKEIYFYDTIEGIYKPYGDTLIEETCQRLIDECRKHTVSEVVEAIRRQTYIAQKDLLESRIINTRTGILDPNTFELKQPSPEYLSTTKLPFVINKDARNLKLWNHMLTIIDPKDINLILELLWIYISWNNPFKKMFIFKGLSNTQKTALVNIIVMIIGKENMATQPINVYLSKNNRFGTSKFIGRRGNIATEIGNITKEQLEMQKSLVGGELQNTEKKNDNKEYIFDPTRFVFLFTTNELGDIFTSINDNSIVGRIQFIIFRNIIDGSKANGDWLETFFTDADDRETAISTIVNIVINYKKAQSQGKIPKTRWSTIEETKKILHDELPLEDQYFRDERLVRKDGSKLTMDEIHEDIQKFIGYKINKQELGYILKKNGLESSQSNGKTIYKGWAFNVAKDQSLLEKQ